MKFTSDIWISDVIPVRMIRITAQWLDDDFHMTGAFLHAEEFSGSHTAFETMFETWNIKKRGCGLSFEIMYKMWPRLWGVELQAWAVWHTLYSFTRVFTLSFVRDVKTSSVTCQIMLLCYICNTSSINHLVL